MDKLTRQEEQVMLAIYQLGEGAYLVSIRDQLKKLTGKYLDVGTIYVPLKRLNMKGFLEASLGEVTAVRGGKRIKYYRLTQKAFSTLKELKQVQERLWENFSFPSNIEEIK